MEEKIAILMADLSGYTALTETHGPVSAADLIDTYLRIAQTSLVGDCTVHERTGDEVMIISKSCDFLLTTAFQLLNASSQEHNFLQLHGGLHFGDVLKRKGSYFGTTINVASRIAAKANPGTIWCSQEFVEALTDKTLYELQSMGKHAFKNISGEQEMHEINTTNKPVYFIDPVCRMMILNTDNAIKHTGPDDTFFCSEACLEIFIKTRLSNLNE